MHIVQLAYKVTNAKAAALDWSTQHGAGPFFLSENIPLEGVRYRGKLSALDHTSAYGWCGEQMIELVQQNCATPSVFTEHANGLHHCAYFTKDLDVELERLSGQGYAIEMEANTASGVRFAFVAIAGLGHYFEIYQDNPQLRSFYSLVEEAARDWDGQELSLIHI